MRETECCYMGLSGQFMPIPRATLEIQCLGPQNQPHPVTWPAGRVTNFCKAYYSYHIYFSHNSPLVDKEMAQFIPLSYISHIIPFFTIFVRCCINLSYKYFYYRIIPVIHNVSRISKILLFLDSSVYAL